MENFLKEAIEGSGHPLVTNCSFCPTIDWRENDLKKIFAGTDTPRICVSTKGKRRLVELVIKPENFLGINKNDYTIDLRVGEIRMIMVSLANNDSNRNGHLCQKGMLIAWKNCRE